MISNFKTNFVFTNQTDNSTLNLKAKSTLGDSSSAFKSVFNKTVGDVARNSTSNKTTKPDNDFSPADDSQLKYKSFRDLRTEQATYNQVSAHKEDQSKLVSDGEKTETDKVSNPSKKFDEQLSILAQMLGITPGELTKIAESLGFKAEDFNDTTKLGQIVDKLGDLLQLNAEQKELLVNLSQEIVKQVGSSDNKQEIKQALTSEKSNTAEDISLVGNEHSDLSGISETIKSKIDELLQNSDLKKDTISSEVSRAIAAMKAQLQNKKDIITDEATKADNDVKLENLNVPAENANQMIDSAASKSEIKHNTKSNEDNTDNKTSSANSDAGTVIKSVSVQTSGNPDQNSQQQVMQDFSQVKQVIANNQTETTKSTFEMPRTVNPDELLSQVVEQTKVVIGQDKTEMVIHLKPDHLGKLELKVVTEQGIVAAKFIAENQKVKEIIETNMQQLKDSLEKQGINIEGVSVQVGQDKKNEYQSSNSFGKQSGMAAKAKTAQAASGITGVRGNIIETLPDRLAPYSYETNTINLTA